MTGNAPAPGSSPGGARLRRGIAAQGISLGLRLLSQLVQLPVLFAFWPVERISAWFLLLGGLTYLGLMAQGITAAGANRLAEPPRDAEAGDAPALFRQVRRRSLALTAGMAVLAAAACWLVSGQALADAAGGTAAAAATLALLGVSVVAGAALMTTEMAFRQAARYPDFILLGAASAAADIAAVALALAGGAGLAGAACALAGARLAAWAVAERRARSIAPDLFARAEAGTAAQSPQPDAGAGLWTPALAFAAGPLVLGFNLQVYLVIASAFYGAAAVAALVATRTLVRVFDLFTAVGSALQFYETEHLGGDRQATQRRLVAGSTVLMLALAFVAAAVLLIAGPAVQHVLTGGETTLDPALALVLLAASTLRGLSASPAAALAAVNDHGAPTGWYAAGSLAAAGFAAGLAASGAPLALALAALIGAEAAQLLPVARRAGRRLGYPAQQFVRDLFSRERLADMAALARHVAGARLAGDNTRLPPARPGR